jgi:hypothetical protein
LVALAVGLMAVLGGLVRPHWTRPSALVASIAVYALLNSTLAPLSGPAGQFAGAKNLITPNAHIAVPSTFNAQYERYQFLLPHPATLHIAPYTPTQEALQLPALLTAHDAVVWQQTGADALPACAQTTPVTCRVLSQRWDIKSRHQPGEIRLGNVLYPEQWLLRREWLLTQTS